MHIDYDEGSTPASGTARCQPNPIVWWSRKTVTFYVANPPGRTREMEALAYRMNTVARDHALPFHVIISHRKWYVVPHAGEMDPFPFQRNTDGALAITMPR